MVEDERVGERMIGRETIVEEGSCGNIRMESKRLKGSMRKQKVREDQELVQIMRGGKPSGCSIVKTQIQPKLN